jgi:hypothetical protein
VVLLDVASGVEAEGAIEEPEASGADIAGAVEDEDEDEEEASGAEAAGAIELEESGAEAEEEASGAEAAGAIDAPEESVMAGALAESVICWVGAVGVFVLLSVVVVVGVASATVV